MSLFSMLADDAALIHASIRDARDSAGGVSIKFPGGSKA